MQSGFRTSATPDSGMSHREGRVAEFSKFCAEVCEDFLAGKGLGFEIWERVLPVNLGEDYYTAIATDGTRHPLVGEHLAAIRAMDDWVATGKGVSPATSWRSAALSVIALPAPEATPRKERGRKM